MKKTEFRWKKNETNFFTLHTQENKQVAFLKMGSANSVVIRQSSLTHCKQCQDQFLPFSTFEYDGMQVLENGKNACLQFTCNNQHRVEKFGSLEECLEIRNKIPRLPPFSF